MKVLVTGSNGFIGKHVTRALNKAGHEVLAYDLDKTEQDLINYVNECDFIVHLAGINRPLTTEEFYNGNTNFTKKVVDLVKASGKNTPIIMSSSIQAALDNDYGKSKKEAEQQAAYEACKIFGVINKKIDNGHLSSDIKCACDNMFTHLIQETGLPRGYIDVVLWKSCQQGLIKL